MKYAIVKNSICVNVIVAGAEYAAEIGAVDIPDGFGIGDIFDGEKWQHCKVEENVDPQADTDAMLVDHEMRLTMLELGI